MTVHTRATQTEEILRMLSDHGINTPKDLQEMLINYFDVCRELTSLQEKMEVFLTGVKEALEMIDDVRPDYD